MMQQLILTNLLNCSKTSAQLAEPSKEESSNFKEITRRKQQLFFEETDTRWRFDNMTTDIRNQTWIGKNLSVLHSMDQTLIGRSGQVLDETKSTITISEAGRNVMLGKSAIKFAIDGSETIINGSLMRQRPEDRIIRTHKEA